MLTSAYWLSQKEKVQVEEVIGIEEGRRYTDPSYRVKRSDGTAVVVDRKDILLAEEEQMVDELAHILYHAKQPARHARYGVIMRYLLKRGVPYVQRLQIQKPVQISPMWFDTGNVCEAVKH